MERAAPAGFGALTEAGPLWHPDLATMIEGVAQGNAGVMGHVGRCAQCRAELALYRAYEHCDEDVPGEDLAWIVSRLSPAAWGASQQSGVFQVIHLAERLFAGFLLIVFSPVIGLVGLVIAALSRCSPFILHARVGRGGAAFRMLKFRTMWGGAPDLGPAPEMKMALDPRVTSRVAAFCRRFSIDELPQLLHVVSGCMSLVGPRPLTPGELKRYYASGAAEVVSVKPGITGLWQVTGRSRLTYSQRKRLDLFYVRHASAGLYLRILLRTIPRVLAGKDSW
jgi:lipopolysaccharide/colanic/teichoic acid biosynthesis glycosyltransferase